MWKWFWVVGMVWAASGNVVVAGSSKLSGGDWYVVNDTVMGGVSSSEVDATEGEGVVFRGTLSLDNNGGFASARTDVADPSWSGGTALKLQLEGDGRTYIATIRTPYPALRRIYYRQSFNTVADEDITRLFADMVPPPRRAPAASRCGTSRHDGRGCAIFAGGGDQQGPAGTRCG